MLSVTFLGTSAARPTVERNVSAMAPARRRDAAVRVRRGHPAPDDALRGELALSEISSRTFTPIIFSGDRADADARYRRAPSRCASTGQGAKQVLGQAIQLGVERVPFESKSRAEARRRCRATCTGNVQRDGYDIHVFGTEHGGGSVGYALKEHERPGRFDPDKARAAGVPEGHLWGKCNGARRSNGGRAEVSADGIVGPSVPGGWWCLRETPAVCCRGRCGAGGGPPDSRGDVLGGGEGAGQGDGHSTACEAAQVALAARLGGWC